MRYLKTTLILFLLTPVLSFSQNKKLDSCYIYHDGLCGKWFEIYEDSSFINMEGCEQYLSIQVGRVKTWGDTVYLQPLSLNHENFIDSIVFVERTEPSDTIDLFIYDCHSNPIGLYEEGITQLDTITFWKKNDSIQTFRSNPTCLTVFDRNSDQFLKTGKFLPKNHKYANSLLSYINTCKDELGYVFNALSNWTGQKKFTPIPKNTVEIKIYYSLPEEIIHHLCRFEHPRLSHDGETIEVNCGGRVYIIN